MAQNNNTQADKVWNHKQIHRFAKAKTRFAQHKINNLLGFGHDVPGNLFKHRNSWQILQIESKDHPYKAYANTIKNGSYVKHMQKYMLRHTNFDSNKMAKALWTSSQQDHSLKIRKNISQKVQHGMNHMSASFKGVNKPASSKLHRAFKGVDRKPVTVTDHTKARLLRAKRNRGIQR